VLDQGSCRCKGPEAESHMCLVTGVRGASISSWLCVVVEEAWGKKGLERAMHRNARSIKVNSGQGASRSTYAKTSRSSDCGSVCHKPSLHS
jgi:hypothetical protein